MSRSRQCLRQEIASRLEVLEGHASAEAVQYKQAMMQVFISGGVKTLKRRIVMALCPNGDWRSSKVQFFVGPHAPAYLRDFANACKFLTTGLMLALTSSQPATYPRHRWTGAELAMDDIGIVEACHRLWSTTFARMCASYASPAASPKILALAKLLAVYDSFSQPRIEDDAAPVDADDNEDAAAVEGEAADDADKGKDGEDVDFAKGQLEGPRPRPQVLRSGPAEALGLDADSP